MYRTQGSISLDEIAIKRVLGLNIVLHQNSEHQIVSLRTISIVKGTRCFLFFFQILKGGKWEHWMLRCSQEIFYLSFDSLLFLLYPSAKYSSHCKPLQSIVHSAPLTDLLWVCTVFNQRKRQEITILVCLLHNMYNNLLQVKKILHDCFIALVAHFSWAVSLGRFRNAEIYCFHLRHLNQISFFPVLCVL